MTDSQAASNAQAWRADAARYNMLWRLVPSVNHKLAGAMQPITMLAGMVARHLQRPQTDVQALTQQVANLQQACKAAVATRTDILAWFQPSEQKRVSLGTEVAQCASLLTGEFAIRGCSIENLAPDDLPLARQACVRNLLTAALFGILDNAGGPVAVQLGATAHGGDDTSIDVSWTRLAPADLPQPGDTGHTIGWDDVQAIADQLGIAMRRTQTQLSIRFNHA